MSDLIKITEEENENYNSSKTSQHPEIMVVRESQQFLHPPKLKQNTRYTAESDEGQEQVSDDVPSPKFKFETSTTPKEPVKERDIEMQEQEDTGRSLKSFIHSEREPVLAKPVHKKRRVAQTNKQVCFNPFVVMGQLTSHLMGYNTEPFPNGAYASCLLAKYLLLILLLFATYKLVDYQVA